MNIKSCLFILTVVVALVVTLMVSHDKSGFQISAAITFACVGAVAFIALLELNNADEQIKAISLKGNKWMDYSFEEAEIRKRLQDDIKIKSAIIRELEEEVKRLEIFNDELKQDVAEAHKAEIDTTAALDKATAQAVAFQKAAKDEEKRFWKLAAYTTLVEKNCLDILHGQITWAERGLFISHYEKLLKETERNFPKLIKKS